MNQIAQDLIQKTAESIKRRDEDDRDKNTSLGNNISKHANNADASKVSRGTVKSPFKILGIADDGKAYFLNHENRMLAYDLESLSKTKLMRLAGLGHYMKIYDGNPPRWAWDLEIDQIMQQSEKKDFDIENCRGRGAWKDDHGICYHDGKNTIGDFDPKIIFLRKPVKNIGLSSPDCPAEIRKQIMEVLKTFSFETPSDAVRLGSHAAVSPFGGALTWRTAIIVTGPSGSGKSTVVDNVAKAISGPCISWGGETSEAAIRQFSANDSTQEYIDEMDGASQKDRDRIDGILSLMRSSTSDNSPVTGKGSVSGKVSIFRMKSMFCFVAVNDAVSNAANDNRMVRVNFKKQNNFEAYVKNMAKIKALLTKENCNGIRAFTWRNLKKIIAIGERLELIIQITTKQDARFAAGESILLAVNLVVWENQTEELSEEFLTNYVKDFYQNQTQEEKRDEVTEMIDKLLNETVLFGPDRIRLSFRFMLIEMKRFLDYKNGTKEEISSMVLTDTIIGYETYREYKKTVEQYGLSVHIKSRELAIAQNHKEIKRVINLGSGYQRQLERHLNVILKRFNILIDHGAKTCTVISGFINFEGEG